MDNENGSDGNGSEPNNPNPFDNESSGLRVNWLWYFPTLLWVLWYFSWGSLLRAMGLFKLAERRWSWGIVLSPSAYVCFAATISSVLIPLWIVMMIPAYFGAEVGPVTFRRRYLYTAGTLLSIFVVAIVLEFIIWGSFPLNVDAHGAISLRLIPFFPWPEGQYMQF